MREYFVHRGVDNEIEFRGLKGKYFKIALAAGGATVFLCLLVHMIGMPEIITMIMFAGGLAGSYYGPTHYFKKYGRWGAVKKPVEKFQPKYVTRKESMESLVPVKKIKIK